MFNIIEDAWHRAALTLQLERTVRINDPWIVCTQSNETMRSAGVRGGGESVRLDVPNDLAKMTATMPRVLGPTGCGREAGQVTLVGFTA